MRGNVLRRSYCSGRAMCLPPLAQDTAAGQRHVTKDPATGAGSVRSGPRTRFERSYFLVASPFFAVAAPLSFAGAAAHRALGVHPQRKTPLRRAGSFIAVPSRQGLRARRVVTLRARVTAPLAIRCGGEASARPRGRPAWPARRRR